MADQITKSPSKIRVAAISRNGYYRVATRIMNPNIEDLHWYTYIGLPDYTDWETADKKAREIAEKQGFEYVNMR